MFTSLLLKGHWHFLVKKEVLNLFALNWICCTIRLFELLNCIFKPNKFGMQFFLSWLGFIISFIVLIRVSRLFFQVHNFTIRIKFVILKIWVLKSPANIYEYTFLESWIYASIYPMTFFMHFNWQTNKRKHILRHAIFQTTSNFAVALIRVVVQTHEVGVWNYVFSCDYFLYDEKIWSINRILCSL